MLTMPPVVSTVPVLVIPLAAAIAPEELTWKRSPEPTVRAAAGVVSPIPRLPDVMKELSPDLLPR